jgi:hypothetical protein
MASMRTSANVYANAIFHVALPDKAHVANISQYIDGVAGLLTTNLVLAGAF